MSGGMWLKRKQVHNCHPI
jgi:hypothetical protein